MAGMDQQIRRRPINGGHAHLAWCRDVQGRCGLGQIIGVVRRDVENADGWICGATVGSGIRIGHDRLLDLMKVVVSYTWHFTEPTTERALLRNT